MDPKWCQNVTQDGSFYATKDGVCGYLSDGELLLDGPRSQYVKPCPTTLIVVFLGVVLVVLEVVVGERKFVCAPGCRQSHLLLWDKHKDYTYVGTLDDLYQHTLIATGTRLRPLEATFLGYMLGSEPFKNLRVSGRSRRFYWSSWAS